MKLADTTFVKELHDSGINLSEVRLTAFEREIAAELPPDYREFLLLRNGGSFYAPVAFPLATDEYSDELRIATVYSLFEPVDEQEGDILRVLEDHRGRIPANSLPIADDGDNLLLIDLRPKAEGALFLWRRDDEMVREAEENRILAARSFREMAIQSYVSLGYPSNATLPPFIAVEHFDARRLDELISRGVSPDSVDEHRMPLIVAVCSRRNVEAAAVLLTRGADVDQTEPRGFTGLWYAAGSGARDLVQLLLRYGAQRHLPDDPGTNILDRLRPPPRGRIATLLGGSSDGT